MPVFDIPDEIRNSRVEVTIRPVEETSHDSEGTAERIKQFREKYNREVFTGQLKEKAARGHSFAFDILKVIDGTETEEEAQARYRLEKQAWGDAVREKTQGGKL